MRETAISPLAFWLYVVGSTVMAGNTGAMIMTWWYIHRSVDSRSSSQLASVRAILFGFCSLAMAFAALATAPKSLIPPDTALWGVRICWVFITVTACVLTDLSVSHLNGKASVVYRMLHWWDFRKGV